MADETAEKKSDSGGASDVVRGVLGVVLQVVAAVLALCALAVVVGIVLVVLEADNRAGGDGNGLARFFIGPAPGGIEGNPSGEEGVAPRLIGAFEGLFDFDSLKTTVAVNWGIAAALYGVLAGVLNRVASAVKP